MEISVKDIYRCDWSTAVHNWGLTIDPCFDKNAWTEFHENPTDRWVNDTSQSGWRIVSTQGANLVRDNVIIKRDTAFSALWCLRNDQIYFAATVFVLQPRSLEETCLYSLFSEWMDTKAGRDSEQGRY